MVVLVRYCLYKPYLKSISFVFSLFILVFISLCYYNFLSINTLERKLQTVIQTTVDVTKRFHGYYTNANKKYYNSGVYIENIDGAELGIIVNKDSCINKIDKGIQQLKNEIEQIIGKDLLWTVAVIEMGDTTGEVSHFYPLRGAYTALDGNYNPKNLIARAVLDENIDESYKIFNKNNIRLTEPYLEKGTGEYIKSILYPVYIDKKLQALIIVDFKNELIQSNISKFNEKHYTSLIAVSSKKLFSYNITFPHTLSNYNYYIGWCTKYTLLQALLLTLFILVIILIIKSVYNKIFKQYYFDNMTSFLRRDHYEQKIQKFSNMDVIICDIDHFKSINDTYGHDVGDIVIEQVAKKIRNCIRKKDIAIRWGGEEFVIIFSGLNGEAIKNKAEQIRKAVCHEPINQIYVTLSCGCANQHDGEKIIDTLERADKALYLSKSSGRNQVTYHSEMKIE
ncbi:GGDEF domain-containing protein [Photobacterium leiognathi]|uniref:GGDEF domain-containing protein n=1 Tax=Photobacterium leiognathi TaxID=553611 RepID=UPI0029810B1E|nr:GGDEF domain-containing protein [Photobacterium leiognathi]